MRWGESGINEGRGSVDIAAQMKQALANTDEDYGHD